MRQKSLLISVGACLFYAILMIIIFLPAVPDFQTRLFGEGGDAYMYLWGTWWFSHQVETGGINSLYDCPLMLHPFGANLIQHDFMLIPNAMAWALSKIGLSLVGAYNMSIIIAMWLNALCAFLLAFTVAGKNDKWNNDTYVWFLSALAGGMVFAFSPYFWSRFRGHLTLLHAYPLPLLALCLYKGSTTNKYAWYGGAGCALILAALCNYYYFIFGVLYMILFYLYHARQFCFSFQKRERQFPVITETLVVIAAILLALTIAIVLTGGMIYEIAGIRIRMQNTSNTMIGCWICLLGAGIMRYRIRVDEFRWRDGWSGARLWNNSKWALLPLIVLVPLFIDGLSLLFSGEYAKQRISWKTGPAGAYLIGFAVPNIYHSLWGEPLRRVFVRWDIMEGLSAGLGLTAIVLVYVTRSWKGSGWWKFSFISAVVIALGPFVRLMPGLEHGPVLPFWFIRYLPIIGGARIPGRWITVALIAWAILVTRALRMPMPAFLRIGCFVLIAFETVSFPGWTSDTHVPAIYHKIAADPVSGAVLELPFGISDGRRSWGSPFPPELAYYQTIHKRPLAGGYLSRVPDKIFDDYKAEPVLSSLVLLQQGQIANVSRASLCDLCVRWNIRWVVLDEKRAVPKLIRTISRLLSPVQAKNDSKSLFLVACNGITMQVSAQPMR